MTVNILKHTYSAPEAELLEVRFEESYLASSGSASKAVYAGYTASGNASLQFNDDNKAGIVTTGSGGKVRKVSVVWNGLTANARSLAIYTSHTPFKSADDLYSNSRQGELQGSLSMGWPMTTFLIKGDWEYVALRSDDKTLYITEIDTAWEED